ncbi:hypothetical protein BD626DRAFT_567851 [Schizophyllum amplum]|uniref:Uncharacterized protein n=1 Tax=Schizophyllum amplum TaxID=97359 RepID=A0A550CJQ1_9AGAR|nr:hypothetical protein BD626DRAFT_567851 [Auriculariopsis ampla]
MPLLVASDDVDVGRLKYLVTYTAVMFVLYGLNISSYFTASAILTSRGIWTFRPRLYLLAAITLMFITTSTYVVLDVIVTLYQTQEASNSLSKAENTILTRLYVAENIVLRWNFIISDAIVVWRAWILWNTSRLARQILMVCLCLTCGAIIADIGVVAWRIMVPTLDNKSSVLLSMLWTMPTLLCNLSVTTLMAVKAWPSWTQHRWLYGDTLMTRGSTRRISKALQVLFSTGFLYCCVCALLVTAGLVQDQAQTFAAVMGTVGVCIAGIYPTLIVIWAALEPEHEPDFVPSSARQHVDLQFSNPHRQAIDTECVVELHSRDSHAYRASTIQDEFAKDCR